MKYTQPCAALLAYAAVVLASPDASALSTDKVAGDGDTLQATVLRPATRWDFPTSGVDGIRASKHLTLYYAEGGVADPMNEHKFGLVNLNLTIPAVNIDHADAVNLDDVTDTVTVTFTDATSFGVAQESWSSLDELLFFTTAPGCKPLDDDDFCTVLVKDLVFDATIRTASAKTTIVDSDTYADTFDFKYGTYVPEASGGLIKRSTKKLVCEQDSNGLFTTDETLSFDRRLDACQGYDTDLEASGDEEFVEQVGGDQIGESKQTADDTNLDGLRNLIDFAKARANIDKSSDNKPATTTPTKNKPATTTPAKNKPATTTPAKNKPSTNKPSTNKPSTNKPSTNKPSTNKPSTNKPSTNKPKKKFSSAVARRDLEKRFFSISLPKIPGINSPITKSFEKDFKFDLPSNRGPDESVFGKAKLLKKWTKSSTKGATNVEGELSLYCVDCGITGSFNIAGQGTGAVTTGVEKASLTLTGNLDAGLKIGIAAEGTLKTEKSDITLGEFAIAGVKFYKLKAGIILRVAADYQLTATAKGQLLVGGNVVIQNGRTYLDFKDSTKSSSSGWKPVFRPTFEASGELGLAAEVGLPLAISAAVTWNDKGLNAGFIERPALEAKAQFAASADASGTKIVETDGCKGISTMLTFKNELYADLLGRKVEMMTPFEEKLTKGCIKIGKQDDTPSSTTSSSATATPTADPEETGDDTGDDTSDSAVSARIAATTMKKSRFAGYNTTTNGGTEYTMLVDSSRSLFLMSCPDGNLYLRERTSAEVSGSADKTCSNLFQSTSSGVVGDGNSQLIHYYQDTMSALGVSRLRVHRNSQMPKQSEFVVLTPNFIGDDSTTLTPDADVNDNAKGQTPYYFAKDKDGNQFNLAVCSFENPSLFPAKLFLMSGDVDEGLTKLQSEEVRATVTGGVTTGCWFMALTQPAGQKGSDWNDDWTVDQTDSFTDF
ncbi:UPF0518 protein [Sphaceloma murrayae]|uniref:UPF0518 protein n=1 Tax=Sphaceloma murrayae TaxID=2082308 RepID=A0A2K1QQ24_9PEZI|nr:UPF0518 protein [Sphaceloma murrayae]